MSAPNAYRADCTQCFGLCCVAPAFAASVDFAIDKPSGKPCPNLLADFRCGIHTELRDRGFPGCTVFDCFGAGQKVSQSTFEGRSWRDSPESAPAMFATFGVMRQLHELLYYISEALTLRAARSVHTDLRTSLDEVEELTRRPAAELMRVDIEIPRHRANLLLRRASELTRAGIPGKKKDYSGADLIGADLSGIMLRGASFRGSFLIGAVLRGADLMGADFTGADMRDADLRGADCAGAIFLTQPQLVAAKGDNSSRIPTRLARPTNW